MRIVMNEKIVALISGCLIPMLLKIYTKADDKCDFLEDQNKTMECSFRRLHNIPQMNNNCRVINLTSSVIGTLNSDSFQMYSKVEVLIMEYAHVTLLSDYEVLTPLNNLRTLIMDGSIMLDPQNLTWPSNIEELSLAKLNLSTLNFENRLPRLRKITLSENYFRSFPKLNPASPLEIINFDENEINITAKDIMPYCQLKYLHANRIYLEHKNRTDKIFCECWSLVDWLLNHEIEYNFQCGEVSPHSRIDCNFTIPEKALVQYEMCVEQLPKKWIEVLKKYTKIGAVALLSLTIFYIVLHIITIKPTRSSTSSLSKREKKQPVDTSNEKQVNKDLEAQEAE